LIVEPVASTRRRGKGPSSDPGATELEELERRGMKKKNELDREKELFRLWIEYLKRSPDYKEFCEWMAKKRKNPKLLPPIKFHKDPKTGSSPKEISNYFSFGPVHDPRWSFDDWWIDHKKKLTYRKNYSIPRAVENYLEFIEKDIDSCVESFKRRKGRKPTLQKFRDYFLKRLNTETHFSFFMINNAESKEIIEAEFKKMLKERKRDPLIKGHELSCKRRYLPSTNYVRMDELRRHLRIYDKKIKEGLKIDEIIKTDEYYRTRKEKDEIARRLVYMDVTKAKKIIENVEHGIFPGKYEGVKARFR
jgi:hypothetical protein